MPLGQWRAVAPSKNVFVCASFLDELAQLAGRDPIEFFLAFVGPTRRAPVFESYALDVGRLRGVAEHVRMLCDWGTALPEGCGRGFAAAYTNTAFVAEVVEVDMRTTGELKVPRVWVAIDCGRIINPLGADAQVAGAICEGLGAALHGEVRFEHGAVSTTNFDRYRILRLPEAPDVKVAFINQQESPRGLGEPALPPLAPALCNAIYAASGRRIRRLPIASQFA